MLDKIQIDILNLLSGDEYITSETLGFQLHRSAKTIRNKINEMKEYLSRYDAHIEMKKGSGYRLIVENTKLFSNCFVSEAKEANLLDSEDIFNELVHILIHTNQYIRTDELVDTLYISKSTLTKYLNELRLFLKQYDLDIERKPHYGLRIKGSEFNYRRFIASKYVQNYSLQPFGSKRFMNDMDQQLIELKRDIRNIVETEMIKYKYGAREAIVDSLVAHLMITVLRVRQGISIDLENSILIDGSSTTNLMVDEIIAKVSELENVQFPKIEQDYVHMHFLSKEVLKYDEAESIPHEVNELINRILFQIKDDRGIDLINNLDLRTLLGLHMVPLLHRLEFGTILRNPILEEIKLACVSGYDLAIIASKIIEETYEVEVHDDEISYLAMHFDVALNKEADKISKKSILIVCASGRASSQLLKYKFQQNFQQYLSSIEVCDIQELKSYIESNVYDYIFSTVPIHMNTAIPIFLK